MSLEMSLEADTRLERSDIDDVLEAMGVTDVERSEGFDRAYFPNSGINLYIRENKPSRPPRTETAEVADWSIGLVLTFRYFTPKFDECQKDLKLFVERLTKVSDAFFVVAFQFEEMHAIRDEAGLRFFLGLQGESQAG